ncbi:MAG: thioesterase family protein [bacterium]
MAEVDHRKRRQIRRKLRITPAFRQIDMMGVVHNSQYFLWFEEGRLQIMLEVMSFEEAVRRMISMPVVENKCHYLRPAKYGDSLVLLTRHRIQVSYDGRLVFEHSLVHEKTKEEVARGHTVTTLVDVRTGRLVKDWPADVWERYRTMV